MSLNWQQARVKFPEANFLRSHEWGKANQRMGHKVIKRSLSSAGYAQVIIKDAKRGRYMEVPGGPLIDWSNEDNARKMFEMLTRTAKSHRCAFIRVRPQLPDTPENRDLFKRLGLRLAPMHLHAEHTVMIDLTKDTEQLLADMRRQTRYEVRRAEKLGIQVTHEHNENIFREFRGVQAETAARQHFVPPDLRTLLAEHEAFGRNAQIYIAKTADQKPIAYGLIIESGDEADYFEAASTDLNRKLPGSYAIQWQVIREMKAKGHKRYNLWGIAPPNQPNHRYAGVTTFKTGFGGEQIAYLPAHDLVISHLRYLPNLIIEKLRKKHRHL